MHCLRPGGLELTRHALSFSQLGPKTRLLDIGCGNGESLAMICAEYGCQVAAIEPDANRYRQALAANPGVEITQAMAEQLPFAAASFDIVLAECSFSLFEQPDKALAEIHRVLLPGGKLLITDTYARGARGVCGEGMVRHLYSVGQFRGMLTEAGFSVLHGEDCGEILKTMLAQMILDDGKEEAYRRLGLDRCAFKQAQAGYLLLVAQAV